VGDEKIASKLTGLNFYSTTYTADQVGTYLGVITDFLAIKPEKPILIEFQRIDMDKPAQIYCNSLFINHGDMGRVWLKVPITELPVITTVWYSTDDKILNQGLYINVTQLNRKKHKVKLKNLSGVEMGVPVENGATFIPLDKIDTNILVYTRKGETKGLPVLSLP
jgi:hypothetical protein